MKCSMPSPAQNTSSTLASELLSLAIAAANTCLSTNVNAKEVIPKKGAGSRVSYETIIM